MNEVPTTPGQSVRVLLADDDAALRAEVASILRGEGMSVDEVGTGTDALAAMARAQFDLVITDVDMPGTAGLEVAARARTMGETVPILVITGLRQRGLADAVTRLQRAQLLLKPFELDELLDAVHRLLGTPATQLASERPTQPPAAAPLFPPDLVPLVRAALGASPSSLAGVPDVLVAELLSAIFFAGLQAEEGERSPVRVVFVGAAGAPEAAAGQSVEPLYRWSRLRLRVPRRLSTRQLVKLARASSGSERTFIEVDIREGRLTISGLSREGVNLEGDPFLEIVAAKPGSLSVRAGRERVLEYEQGHVQASDGSLVVARGPVRAALERIAASAQTESAVVPHYLEAVHSLVGELAAHGAGGILVVSADEDLELPPGAGYQTFPDVSLLPILERLHGRGARAAAGARERARPLELLELLRGTYLAELERTVAELGALTALDGATILDPALSLVGFGVALPVGQVRFEVVEAEGLEGEVRHPFDLGLRGTRHRAAAHWAHEHPGTVVFVASQDGGLVCLLRESERDDVVLWRFRATRPSRV